MTCLYNGHPLKHWASLYGMRVTTLAQRLARGMSLTQALTQPLVPRSKRSSSGREPLADQHRTKVLELWTQGLARSQITERLRISRPTVNFILKDKPRRYVMAGSTSQAGVSFGALKTFGRRT